MATERHFDIVATAGPQRAPARAQDRGLRAAQSPGWGIDRRDLMTGALAAALAGCVRPADGAQPLPSPSGRIGDAHVHLFNGADLPVTGFFRDVLVPAYLANWPEVALAIIDIAFGVLKDASKTAAAELQDLQSLTVPAELTAAEFADRVAARGEAAMRGTAANAARDPRHNLADSYAALVEIVATEGRIRRRRSLNPAPGQRLPFNRRALADIAANGADAAAIDRRAQALRRSPAELFALIAWAFQMTHSRSAHVREYLRAMSTGTDRPALLINLLVDYDLWLDDAPKAGSAQTDQVRFWTRYSAMHQDQVRIETFAGFDPLKHAVEKRLGATPYFDALKAWATAPADAPQRVSGFKLYPPMGFSVWRNDPLPDASPDGRAAENVRALWRKNGWPVADVPARLDDALDDLFAFTTAHDVPLLAHGRDSNAAYPGAGRKAHPRYWLDRARHLKPTPGRYPLRACVAHLRKEPDSFQAVEDILALNRLGGSNIYFDIAFDDELLAPAAADRLLQDLKDLCHGDPGLAKYLMFGSDWIMLAQIPHADRYLTAFDQAVERSDFWAPLRGDLIGGNLRRFLRLAP